MNHYLPSSELILDEQQRIYHLNINPEELADTVILVGDPHRVALISQHFDNVELKRQEREFVTHTGYLNNKRLTVIATAISTANVDIVLNELDALVNIDLATRQPKQKLRKLTIFRLARQGA